MYIIWEYLLFDYGCGGMGERPREKKSMRIRFGFVFKGRGTT